MTESADFDVLSSVLASFKLRVHVFKTGRYCGPWALDSKGVKHATTFHLIGRGSAWAHWEGQRTPLPVHSGDLVFFPHAGWHQISGTPELQPGLCESSDGDGPFTTVLCSAVEFATPAANPVLQALPEVVVIRGEEQQTSAQLQALARVMLAEYESASIGQQGVLDRLAEAMFVLIIRQYLRQSPEPSGLLAALADERIARSLSALHRAPEQDWDVAGLAAQAGLSRSAFLHHFRELLGESPMHYLTAWRMHLAEDLLHERRNSVARVAEQLGYRTETAFRRAFKRHRGHGPGAVRRTLGARGRA